MQREVHPAITLRPFREAFDNKNTLALSEKRDSVIFGFLGIQAFGNVTPEQLEQIWKDNFTVNATPPAYLFAMAGIADRMSALLTIAFPGAPVSNFPPDTTKRATSQEHRLAYQGREIDSLSRYFTKPDDVKSDNQDGDD